MLLEFGLFDKLRNFTQEELNLLTVRHQSRKYRATIKFAR